MSYPVSFSVDYHETYSRGDLLLKVLLGWLILIPHVFCLAFYELWVLLQLIAAFFIILFTGKFPEGMFNSVTSFIRWSTNINCYSGVLVVDQYPPFSGEQKDYPVKLAVEYPASLSRGMLLLKVFFGCLYVGIPHGICLWLLGMVAEIIAFIAFFTILFAGTYPKGMFDLSVGYVRWSTNVSAYLMFLTDQYPPFSLEQK